MLIATYEKRYKNMKREHKFEKKLRVDTFIYIRDKCWLASHYFFHLTML